MDARTIGAEGRAGLEELLEQACSCLTCFGQDYVDAIAELQQLRDRLTSGTFRLAVLGQFKRGKSTLLNALLGQELLPTDILPVTAIPTFIFSSEAVSAEVVFAAEATPPIRFSADSGLSLGDFLNRYVTEAGNPNNQLGVARVEIGHPAPILRQGVVLIDTPGIGSTHRHNTEVAYQVLPQCDAALFLVSPDPPITEMELDYLKEIKACLPRTFFLLNKIDNLTEQERVASINFLAEQLRPLCQALPQVIAVSARAGLQARLNEDLSAWKKSGMSQVENSLIDFFASEKKQVFHESLQRKIHDQIHHIRLRLQLSLNALMLPEGELKQKIEQFRRALPEIDREKQIAEDILSGDHDRVVAVLNREINEVRSRAKKSILEPVEVHLRTIDDTEELERVCRQALLEEIPLYFAPAMRKVEEAIRQEAVSLLQLHQQRCDELIERVRQVAAELFSIPYRAPFAGQALLAFEVPGWSSQLFISDMDPIGQKISRRFFTRKYRHKKTVKRLRQEALKLIGLNVEQISWALRKGVDESFRKYRVQLDEQLEKTIYATKQAMEIALDKNKSLVTESSGLEIRLSKAINTLDGLVSKED